jgi:hypothetical protein
LRRRLRRALVELNGRPSADSWFRSALGMDGTFRTRETIVDGVALAH